MREPITIKKNVLFAFALEELDALSPTIKPIFGCFAVYIGEKMILFMILNGDPRIGRAPEEKRFKPTRKGRI
jgi:hypothetical protein